MIGIYDIGPMDAYGIGACSWAFKQRRKVKWRTVVITRSRPLRDVVWMRRFGWP